MNVPLRLATASVCLLPVAALGAERAAIRPGLWEITHQTEIAGRPPVPDDVLARMPPEARARIEAAMKGQGAGGAGGGHASRQCITDQDIDRGFTPETARQQCTQKVLSQTRTSMEVAVECTSADGQGGTARGTVKWSAASPESMTGTIDMTMTQGAQSTTTHATLKGHWLGTDCGDVKPRKRD